MQRDTTKHFFFIPTTSSEDWRCLLAMPETQWKPGCSAYELACCWEASGGFPPEVCELLTGSSYPHFRAIEMLLAFPEFQVSLPGKGKPSQPDIFVLAKDADGALVSIAVEGKVAESFGPLLGEWRAGASSNALIRLAGLQAELGLGVEPPTHVRYQLLHRAASAVILARRFNAPSAVMIVHSFSQTDAWLADYQQFVRLFGIEPPGKALILLNEVDGIRLYAGWATGDPAYVHV